MLREFIKKKRRTQLHRLIAPSCIFICHQVPRIPRPPVSYAVTVATASSDTRLVALCPPPALFLPSAQLPPFACPPPPQDQPHLAATVVLLFSTPGRPCAPISCRPRYQARILHAPSPPYSSGLSGMTPLSFPPAPPPRNPTHLCRPTSPNLRARCQDRVLCAPYLAVPPLFARRPRCRPHQALGTASFSPHAYHLPSTSLLFPLGYPPISHL